MNLNVINCLPGTELSSEPHKDPTVENNVHKVATMANNVNKVYKVHSVAKMAYKVNLANTVSQVHIVIKSKYCSQNGKSSKYSKSSRYNYK